MRLYLKQKVFSWKDKFSVKNSDGDDLYFVEGKVISVGKKLRIYNAEGDELAFVKQKVVALTPKFLVEIDGRDVAQIVKKVTLFKPKYIVKGPDWEVKGDLFSHDYTIIDKNRPIITIHKKWMSWGDTFELEVEDGTDTVTALAVVLAIDAVMDAEAAVAAAASQNQ